MIWNSQQERDDSFFYLEHNRDERKRVNKRRQRQTQSRRRMRH